MQSVDGDVRLSVSLDTKSVKKNITDLGKSVKDSLNQNSDANSSKVLNQLYQDADRLSKRIQELQTELKNLTSTTPTKDFTSLQQQIANTTQYYNTVVERAEELRTQISQTSESSAEYATLVSDLKFFEDEIQNTRAELDALRNKQQELIDSGQANIVGDPAEIEQTQQALEQTTADYDDVINRIEQVHTEQADTSASSTFRDQFSRIAGVAKTALGKVGRLLKQVGIVAVQAFGKLALTAKSAFGAIVRHAKSSSKGAGNAVTNLTGAFRKGLKTILKYGLGIRGVFMLFRKLRSAVKEGLGNLAQYSDEVNQDISGLMSAFTRLKNSLATMFQPLIKIVAPILTTLINKASQVATSIGKVIASFAGQSYVYEAVDVQEDYAKSLDKTSNSAKKAKKALEGYLSPLDDINRYQEDTKTDTDDDGTVDLSKMFKLTAVDSKFKDLADRIKKLLKSKDWTNLGLILGKTLNGIFNKIDWNAIQQKAFNVVDRLATFLNGAIRSVDWGLIGKTFSTGIITILETVTRFIQKIDWTTIGKSIVRFLNGFRFSGLSTAAMNLLDGFSTALRKIDFVQIGDAFRKGLSRINWKGIWNSLTRLISTALRGLTDFFGLKGIDTNKLKRSLQDLYKPVSDLFKTLKNTVSELLKPTINELLPAAVSVIGNIIKGVEPVIKALTPLFKTAISVISKIVKSLAPAIATMGKTIGTIIKNVSPILQPILQLIGHVVEFLAPAVDFILGAIGKISDFLSPISDFIGNIISEVSNLFGWLSGSNGEVTISAQLQEEIDHLAGASDGFNTISGNISGSISAIDENIQGTMSDLTYINNLQSRLDELMNKATLSDSEMQELKTIGDLLSEKLPAFEKTWDAMIKTDENGKLVFTKNRAEAVKSIDEVINKLKEQYTVEALQEQYKEALKAKQQAAQDYRAKLDEASKAQEKLNKLGEEMTAKNKELAQAEKDFWGGNLSSEDYNKKVDAAKKARAEYDEYKKTFENLQENALKAGGKIGEMDKKLEGLSTAMGVVKTNGDGLYNSLQALRTTFDYGLIDMDTITKNTGKNAKELFAQTKSLAEQSAAGYEKGIQDSKKTLTDAGVTIATDAIDGARKGLDSHSPSKKFIKIGEDSVEGLEIGFKNRTPKILTLIKSLTTTINDAMTKGVAGLGSTFNPLPNLIKKNLNVVLQYFENFLGHLTDGINNSFSQINSLNKAFATSGGKNSSYTIWNNIPKINIPLLAKGAVIPPNKEFLAVLGDQKRGNNIEAPEDLIRKIIHEELANSQNSKNVYEIPIVVGRRTLTKLVIDEARLMLSQTGKNPFDLIQV